MDSSIKTGTPALLAAAIEKNPLAPDVELFLESLDLTAEERLAVVESLPAFQIALKDGKGVQTVQAYGWNWA